MDYNLEIIHQISSYIIQQINENEKNIKNTNNISKKSIFNLYFEEDEEEGEKEENKIIYTLDFIQEYIQFVYEDTKMEFESVIAGIIYFKRIIETENILINSKNWRNLIATCFMIASKTWDDFSMINSDFRLIFPDSTLSLVNLLEIECLKMLKFNVSINQEEFSSYRKCYPLEEEEEEEIDSLMCESIVENENKLQSKPSSITIPSPILTSSQITFSSFSSSSSSESPHTIQLLNSFKLNLKSYIEKLKGKQSKIHCL